jgi:hypothetical protein
MQECYRMTKLADASINTFGPSPKADSVPPNDPILEIPASELQGLLKELVRTYNLMADMVKDAGILRGRELARLTESHNHALRAEKSPITKMILLNAYIRQLLTKIRDALKSRPAEGGKIVQVCTKIAARAIQIIDYIKVIAQDDPKRKEIALDSSHTRVLFSGVGGEPVSRKETIRAMRRAESLWPALKCGHRPNDGRKTMRLTISQADMGILPEFEYRDTWQRSRERVELCI